jgi:hypothetical protein
MAQVTIDSTVLAQLLQALQASQAPKQEGPLPPPQRPVLVAYTEAQATTVDAQHVLMPNTGHILSLPQVANGEGLGGYFERVYAQAGATEQFMRNTVGAFMREATMPPGIASNGDPNHDWPLMVDGFCNGAAYGVSSGAPQADFNPGAIVGYAPALTDEQKILAFICETTAPQAKRSAAYSRLQSQLGNDGMINAVQRASSSGLAQGNFYDPTLVSAVQAVINGSPDANIQINLRDNRLTSEWLALVRSVYSSL